MMDTREPDGSYQFYYFMVAHGHVHRECKNGIRFYYTYINTLIDLCKFVCVNEKILGIELQEGSAIEEKWDCWV